ncbi:hypothetical protein [Terriglobus tenax]|uniref:hypothetical protein n=1 Tax=Terriglobus tenax TaxID=1111115 RepID=UPI0021E0217F|nr:hypothetical protein [Terriglobus tenax]
MRTVAALLLLSVLWGVEWLRELLVIPGTPPALRSAIVCTLAAAIFAIAPSERQANGRSLMVGIGLFAVPLLLQRLAYLPGYTNAALWTLAPVFIVVVCGAKLQGLRQDLLMTALAGVAGALLIFPVQFPASLREGVHWLILIAGIASAATASVFAKETPGLKTTGMLGAAVLLWIATAVSGALSISTPELLWIAGVDLPALLLLLWLLQQMKPEELSTRYLLPVVVTILTSWLALHPQISLRFAGGVMLLAASSTGLLLLSRHKV